MPAGTPVRFTSGLFAHERRGDIGAQREASRDRPRDLQLGAVGLCARSRRQPIAGCPPGSPGCAAAGRPRARRRRPAAQSPAPPELSESLWRNRIAIPLPSRTRPVEPRKYHDLRWPDHQIFAGNGGNPVGDLANQYAARSRAAWRRSSSVGRYSCSSTGANGIGVRARPAGAPARPGTRTRARRRWLRPRPRSRP